MVCVRNLAAKLSSEYALQTTYESNCTHSKVLLLLLSQNPFYQGRQTHFVEDSVCRVAVTFQCNSADDLYDFSPGIVSKHFFLFGKWPEVTKLLETKPNAP